MRVRLNDCIYECNKVEYDENTNEYTFHINDNKVRFISVVHKLPSYEENRSSLMDFLLRNGNIYIDDSWLNRKLTTGGEFTDIFIKEICND